MNYKIEKLEKWLPLKMFFDGVNPYDFEIFIKLFKEWIPKDKEIEEYMIISNHRVPYEEFYDYLKRKNFHIVIGHYGPSTRLDIRYALPNCSILTVTDSNIYHYKNYIGKHDHEYDNFLLFKELNSDYLFQKILPCYDKSVEPLITH